MLSTFASLSVNSAKDLARWDEILRCAQDDKRRNFQTNGKDPVARDCFYGVRGNDAPSKG